MNDLTGYVERLRKSGSVYAEEEAQLIVDEAKSESELEELMARREKGEPLEWILGWSEFCGRTVIVREGVFLPRYRTEFLVETAKNFTRSHSRVLDLCCGSGAIAAVLAEHDKTIAIYASDSDPAAVSCARENLQDRGIVFLGDLFDAMPADFSHQFDLILVNAPYVPSNKIEFMPSESRLHEPNSSLNGGEDGLDFHRRIADGAARWLIEDGVLLIETSEEQAPISVSIFSTAGFSAQAISSEEHDVALIMARR